MEHRLPRRTAARVAPTVVAEAGDDAQTVAAVHEHQPDVVLMDIRMPVTSLRRPA
jgi:YesN/AraC family two-component response regulator